MERARMIAISSRSANQLTHQNLLSNSLCDPIHAHSIVSPFRSPTARYCSLIRTDQMLSYPCNFLNRREGADPRQFKDFVKQVVELTR
jgi:hypothetical protein